MRITIVAAALAVVSTHAWAAGPIEAACRGADRQASPTLCVCLQAVADQSLNGADQALAASFFKDPHRAQQIRQSNKRRDEAFWERYKAFGASAENYCAAS